MHKTEKEEAILNGILREFNTARITHGSFNSLHEAYAVLLEEVEELWAGIKHNHPVDWIKREARQVAAMAFGILMEFDNVRKDP